jgi:hypothetical protein
MKEYAIIFIVLLVGVVIVDFTRMPAGWAFYFGAIVGVVLNICLRVK